MITKPGDQKKKERDGDSGGLIMLCLLFILVIGIKINHHHPLYFYNPHRIGTIWDALVGRMTDCHRSLDANPCSL